MSRFGILGNVPVDGKVFPAVSHGHMAAPSLIRVDYRVFKKTVKEKGKLLTLKAKYALVDKGAFKRKEYYFKTTLQF